MTNILNSHIKTSNNAIPAGFLKKEEKKTIGAPQYIYEYSMDKALREKSEFRQNIKVSMFEDSQRKRKKTVKIAAIALITTLIAAFAGFKIHK